ncbi:hypothetical protein PPMP20_21575 [Paraburkholderia phymatum]|uniref:hypothetical protein n=1 Tax=Paraburkholderia phymatum TaxID=148447 RepID=UPI0000E7561C|nr:hypothetical protein [Paraburkholderia phymatum]
MKAVIYKGPRNMKAYRRKLRELIASGKAEPSQIVSRESPQEKAPQGYEHFDARKEGWTKVVLKAAA